MTLRNTISHQYSRVESVFAQEVGDIRLAMEAQEKGIHLRREIRSRQRSKRTCVSKCDINKGSGGNVKTVKCVIKDAAPWIRMREVPRILDWVGTLFGFQPHRPPECTAGLCIARRNFRF